MNQGYIETLDMLEHIYFMKPEDNILTIDFYANMDYEVLIPDNKWLSIAPQQKAKPNSKITLKALKNTESTARYLPVIINSKTSDVYKSIYVMQESSIKKGIYTTKDLIDFLNTRKANDYLELYKSLLDFGSYDSQTKKINIEQKANIDLNPNAVFSDGIITGSVTYKDDSNTNNSPNVFQNIVYDGNNYSIKGYYLDDVVEHFTHDRYTAGLFKGITNSEIRNLKMESGLIRLRGNKNSFISSVGIGVFSSIAENSSFVNCHSDKMLIDIQYSETDEQHHIGGIVGIGSSNLIMKNCSSNVSITVKDLERCFIGGLIGGIDGWNGGCRLLVDNCVVNNVSISSQSELNLEYNNYIGGIIGGINSAMIDQEVSVIKNSKVKNTLITSRTKDIVGGICAWAKLTWSGNFLAPVKLDILDCNVNDNTFVKGRVNEIIYETEETTVRNVTVNNNTISNY